jgi:3D (Asp-Asp-Asp) domain-containing protein
MIYFPRASLSFTMISMSLLACTSGRSWVNQPFQQNHNDKGVRLMEPPPQTANTELPSTEGARINPAPEPPTDEELADAGGTRPNLALQGQKKRDLSRPVDGELLGVFRNTYYDFPAEFSFQGPKVLLMNASCKPISEVPRAFYDAVCVQGSGTLVNGTTVSFSKRDCGCAEVCPRTGQKICFDALDQEQFPWGRGALGKAITPLLSIAVDSTVIPLGTVVYIAEFDGVERRPGGARHDGCFVAEDRGMKVKGEHVDIFTGNPSTTQHLNQVVPSNVGVHVYSGTARCQ